MGLYADGADSDKDESNRSMIIQLTALADIDSGDNHVMTFEK